MTVQICHGDTWKEGTLRVNYTNIMLKRFSSIWSQTGLVGDKNHCNIVGPFSGLEFETVSAVPRGGPQQEETASHGDLKP